MTKKILSLADVQKHLIENYGHQISHVKKDYYDVWGLLKQLDDRALSYVLDLGFEFIEFLPFPTLGDLQFARVRYTGKIDNTEKDRTFKIGKDAIMFDAKIGKKYKIGKDGSTLP